MVMLEALGQGVLFGLLLSALIGPVFFALIQTGIAKGFSSGASMALGIAFSDALYVVVASLGVSFLIEQPTFQLWLGWLGGAILFLFGLTNLLKKPGDMQQKGSKQPRSGLLKAMLHGFMLNGINPFVLLFWFSLASMVSLEYKFTVDLRLAFFGAILSTVLLIDLLKVYLANRLRRFVTPRFMGWLNKIVGVVLFGFSLRLFWFAFQQAG